VTRVVIGLRDPFPGHGGGREMLRKAGIRVDGPIDDEDCRRANEPWLTLATKQRAWFCLKAAMTLDGRIATATGESRWITGSEARADAHERRNRADAILVGAGTVAADDPLLTVRGVRGGRDPVRLVLDGKLSMSAKARVLAPGSAAATIIVTTRDAPERKARALARAGAEVWRLPGKKGRVDLRALARALPGRGLVSVLVEGGAETHAGLLEAGLVDRLLLYVGPQVIGGRGAPAWLGGAGVSRLARAPRFRFDGAPRLVGEDVLLEAIPVL
jgi:diaminohydroxyphosphoribosylaminopyrimidine deaminase/5-amino-6-(5-phosphoribosylamino)uracil reductase